MAERIEPPVTQEAVMTDKADTPRRTRILRAAMDEARENCAYFIDDYVYIEDKDAPDTAVPFRLWSAQREGLKAMLDNRLVVGLKARQLGFTWLMLAVAAWTMLKPGRSVLALSKTEEDAKELVRRVEFIFRHLPQWLMRPAGLPDGEGMSYESIATAVTVRHGAGEPSVFKSFPAGPNSGRSFTGNLLLLDEWAYQSYADEIWEAAFPTINRPGGGQVFGVSTMKPGGRFEHTVRGALAGTNGFTLVFWPWDTDPRRTPLWYEQTRRVIGDEAMLREYPATVEEALKAPAGAFFPELDATVHIVKPEPEREPSRQYPEKEHSKHYQRRYASIDYGLDGLAVLWYRVDREGGARVYRELYEKDKTISQAAQLIRERNEGDLIAGFFAPPDLWARRQETGRSLAETFAGCGIYLTRACDRREQGWQAVKDLLLPYETRDVQTGEPLRTAKLVIEQGAAPELWRCLIAARHDTRNYNDILDRTAEEHEITHLIDSLRYFASSRTYPAEEDAVREYGEDGDGDGWRGFLEWGV